MEIPIKGPVLQDTNLFRFKLNQRLEDVSRLFAESKEKLQKRSRKTTLKGGPSKSAAALVASGFKSESEFDTETAMGLYERAVELDPSCTEALLRYSKAMSDLTLEPGTSPAEAQRLVTLAVETAEQALAQEPLSARAHLALAINLARLALYSNNQTKVDLVRRVREGAQRAIELNADEDLAYHLLGRWNNEMASLNVIIKVAINLFYGGLEAGSHAEAKKLFEKCLSLNPSRMVHHVEMGRTHLKLGEIDEACRELTLAMSMDLEDINALHEKYDGQEMLSSLLRGDRSIKTGW
eukprot:CAMPEP_0196595184 /NCGR_PEP_ID=MMETSP1081-20130531/80416_1 /TAXON_ID=36882 /ORGANISM="Pyramimonas amylifera, Strain CCMP720" /LENGTH=294 /DNA_ID=CAMNT_0041919681 /DNA_START=232 /DNA_END=1113 /DNA_ORIENTATION=+